MSAWLLVSLNVSWTGISSIPGMILIVGFSGSSDRSVRLHSSLLNSVLQVKVVACLESAFEPVNQISLSDNNPHGKFLFHRHLDRNKKVI